MHHACYVSVACTESLKFNRQVFAWAGTKDKRGITTQHVTAFRMLPTRLAGLNRTLRNMRVGNFEYVEEGLWLGEWFAR